MFFKRNEPFRFAFQQPIKGTIETFKKEQNTLLHSQSAEAFIMNISPNGMKIVTNIKIDPLEIAHVRISFPLNVSYFEMEGTISWMKGPYGQGYEYGIYVNNSDEVRSLLISQLKIFNRNSQKVQ